MPHYRVDADKGFNFSNVDDAFVCQKKNHFQVSCKDVGTRNFDFRDRYCSRSLFSYNVYFTV